MAAGTVNNNFLGALCKEVTSSAKTGSSSSSNRSRRRAPSLPQVIAAVSLTVCLLLPLPVAAQVDCYYCEESCDSVTGQPTEKCPTECATWYFSEAGTDSVSIGRGCIEFMPQDATVYERCEGSLCNSAQLVRCLRCESELASECQADVICPRSDDQCYLNPADGHRGCTSDQGYESDCPPGSDRCSLCTNPAQPPAAGGQRSCNENLRCVVCQGSAAASCLQDPAAVQSCPSSADQCYRYLDSEQMLHLGCTSSEDYRTNCQPPRNCRTCATDACNRDDVFACYTCSGCYSVDKETLLECTISETSQCYTGFDWQEKETYRGCASLELLLEFDANDLCEESGCNAADFPVHQRCYQCTGCDQISPADTNYCRSDAATGCFMLLRRDSVLVRGCNTDELYASDCQEDRNCVSCDTGDNCNDRPPKVQTICAQCDGLEACDEDPMPYSCADLTFNNRCYVYSDGSGSLVKGCLLDLKPETEMAIACYDPDDPRCQYCAGEIGCNRQHCAVCDSRADGLACVLGKASGTLRYELCSAGCQVLVDAEGHTVRGCANPEPGDACRDQTTVDCFVSQNPGSNGEVFPATRRRCYRCDGAVDERCWEEQQEDPESAGSQYCPLYFGASDACYIYDDGSSFVRGCTTDPDARCRVSDDPNCIFSEDSLGNGAPAQGPPLTCYDRCPDGAATSSSCTTVTCSATENRCFLAVSQTGIISRGCTTYVPGLLDCPDDARDCLLCDEANCNGAFAVCSECDSLLDGDCTVAEDHGDVCEGMDGCFHYVDNDREIFGCAENAPPVCSTTDAAHCQFCTGPFCNGKALSVCFRCVDCPDVLSPVPTTVICAQNGDSCFTGMLLLQDGQSRIDRDCLSELPEPLDAYRELQRCSKRACNTLARSDWVSCYTCPNCPVLSPQATPEACLDPPVNRCYILRTAEGLVERGCATEGALEDGGCREDENCELCLGESCNGKDLVPGFSCVQCEGAGCAERNVVSECRNELGLLYDGCVTYDDGTNVRKGCLSDAGLAALCTDNDASCTVSLEPNGNAREISCFTCSAVTVGCVREQEDISGAPLYEHGACVMLITADGTLVRGSSLEHGTCRDGQNVLCSECFTDGCNGALFPPDRLSCYKCAGEECAQELGTLEPCLKYDGASTSQCYTRFDGRSYAERGCLLDEPNACLLEEGQESTPACQLCESNQCNNGWPPAVGERYEAKTCVKCESNLECETNPREEACEREDAGCFTFYSGQYVIAKGCVANLEAGGSRPTWYEDCASTGGSASCEHCSGDNCNQNRCFACNSSTDDLACLEPRLGQGLVQSTSCRTAGCVAFIDDNGHTVRGCAEDLPTNARDCADDDSDENATCRRCEREHCNGGPLPANRLKCYQCSGSAEDCLAPVKGSERYCPTYPTEGGVIESCFTFFEDEQTVRRGCTQELPPEAGCEGFCRECNTTACNDQPALVTNTLRCGECTGSDECSGPVSSIQCSGEVLFGRPDRCYTLFETGGGAVVRRGCLNSLIPIEAKRCMDAADESCKLCPTDDCNVASVECFVCDSRTQRECADEIPPADDRIVRKPCGTGRCGVRVTSDGVTVRGCGEDFETSCPVSESDLDRPLCAVFDGGLSNGDTFPEDRLRCYQCRGGSCGQINVAQTSPTACQLYDSTDECYTYVTDAGVTIRGCLSDPQAECSDDLARCIRCPQTGCNGAPSEQRNELICAKCSRAADCSAAAVTTFERCAGTIPLGRTDACYTYTFAGEILERGCLSEADESIRGECGTGRVVAGSDCAVCRCDRCNGPPVQCAACEGETGCGEARNDAAQIAKCRTGSCVSFVREVSKDRYTIVKGCSEDYEQETCAAVTTGGAGYQLCHEERCNDVLYPPARVRCYQCEGASCADPQLLPAICEPYDPAKDACYSFLDRQQKGCLGQLQDPDQMNVCEDRSETAVCRVCQSADGCNAEPHVLRCTVCNSADDPGCAGMGEVAATKPCLIGGCITFIDDDGYTVKGCAADFNLAASCTGPLCRLCSDGDGCNDRGELVPPNRLECFQCAGDSDDCLDVSGGLSATVCRRYEPTDACYTYALSPTSVVRGCLSDRPSCTAECVTCTAGGGCNTDPVLVPNTRSCYHCEGTDCARGQTGKGTTCPGVLLLGRNDACYSFVGPYSVRRGCLSEEGACDPNVSPDDCRVCATGDDCNGEGYSVAPRECIQCDEAGDDETCLWGYSSTEAVRCAEEDPPQVAGGGGGGGASCYSCYDAEGLFHRGCPGDEWWGDKGRCRMDTVTICLGSGCNNRNERRQICAKCSGADECEDGRWRVEECQGTVRYERRGCYLLRDTRKRILERGCAATLNETEWERCSNVRDGFCTTCLANQCNGASELREGVAGGLLVAVLAATIRLAFGH